LLVHIENTELNTRQLTLTFTDTGNTWSVLKSTARARLDTVNPTPQDV